LSSKRSISFSPPAANHVSITLSPDTCHILHQFITLVIFDNRQHRPS
jgi:hypothetical protein